MITNPLRKQPSRPVSPKNTVTVHEKPLPLTGWKPDFGLNRLAVIDRDIRDLMRGLAEAKATVEVQGQRHSEQMEHFVLLLLDVMDAFDVIFKAIHATKDASSIALVKIWLDNFRGVYKKLDRALSKQGVTRIECLDLEFDPHWHEIERMDYDLSKPEGRIIEEVKKGYVWRNNQLLRHALVVVITHSLSGAESAKDDTD
jgi:hypothetical protein